MFLEFLPTASGGPHFLVCQYLVSVGHWGEMGYRVVKYKKKTLHDCKK